MYIHYICHLILLCSIPKTWNGIEVLLYCILYYLKLYIKIIKINYILLWLFLIYVFYTYIKLKDGDRSLSSVEQKVWLIFLTMSMTPIFLNNINSTVQNVQKLSWKMTTNHNKLYKNACKHGKTRIAFLHTRWNFSK